MWIIMSFVIGALIGILMTVLATFRTSVSRRTLQKRLDRAEQALEKSRAQNDQAI
ncbi:MAG: LapA family protein [Marinobacter sp.]